MFDRRTKSSHGVKLDPIQNMTRCTIDSRPWANEKGVELRDSECTDDARQREKAQSIHVHININLVSYRVRIIQFPSMPVSVYITPAQKSNLNAHLITPWCRPLADSIHDHKQSYRAPNTTHPRPSRESLVPQSTVAWELGCRT